MSIVTIQNVFDGTTNIRTACGKTQSENWTGSPPQLAVHTTMSAVTGAVCRITADKVGWVQKRRNDNTAVSGVK